MKTIRKIVKVKKNSDKKHENKIEIKIGYEKGSKVPTYINVHKDCTQLDLFACAVHLMEIATQAAIEDGKTNTSFLIHCAKAYIDDMDKE